MRIARRLAQWTAPAAIVTAGIFAGCAAAQGSGTLVVVNQADATVSLVDLGTRAITGTVPTGDGPREVAVSPDGRWALIANHGPPTAPGNTLTLIDIARGTVERTIGLGRHRRPVGVAWLPDGKTALVSAEADSTVLAVEVSSGRITSEVATGQAGSWLIALTPDGARAYVTNAGSASVTMIDLATRRVLRSAGVPPGASGIALRPDGSELWVTSSTANRITVLSADDLTVRGTIASEERPLRVRFTPDGRLALVTFAVSSELKFFDASTRRQTESIAMRVAKAAMHGATAAEGYLNKTVPIGLAISPDGAWAFVANAGADAVTVVSIPDHDPKAVIFVGREPGGLALSALVRPPAP